MNWECNPFFLTCVPLHDFGAGLIEKLILNGNGKRIILPVILANDLVAIAEPIGTQLEEGTYSIEAASVNAVRPIGAIKLDINLTRVKIVLPKDSGKTFAVVLGANGRLLGTNGSERPDDLFDDHAAYNSALVDTLRSLLFAPEDALMDVARQGLLDMSLLTSVVGNKPSSALVEEVMPNIARPIQQRIADHLVKLGIACDVALLIHGSLNYTRASAMFTVDDRSGAKVAFHLDGRRYFFGRITKVPGVATLSYYSFDIGHTPLHELGHAASERSHGQIVDLYHDQVSDSYLQINKKNGRPIPSTFARYSTMDFNSDHTRDHIGYETNWTSYHPELRNRDCPNLMDDYWQAQSDPLDCQFDHLTRTWLLDRIRAKAG